MRIPRIEIGNYRVVNEMFCQLEYRRPCILVWGYVNIFFSKPVASGSTRVVRIVQIKNTMLKIRERTVSINPTPEKIMLKKPQVSTTFPRNTISLLKHPVSPTPPFFFPNPQQIPKQLSYPHLASIAHSPTAQVSDSQ